MGQLQGQAGVGGMMLLAGRPPWAAFGKLARKSSEPRQEKACVQAEMTETENPKLWGHQKVGKGDCCVQKANGKRCEGKML